MRNLVIGLVLLNLAFFAYEMWIDTPDLTPADTAPALPRLLLASEFPQEPPANGEAATPRTGPHAAPAPPDTTSQSTLPQVTPAAATACVAVGPFGDVDVAAHAASILKDRGFEPRQRGAPGQITEGYWVHVENIATAADQSRVMRNLQQAGLSDASPVQAADQARHISVGIFSDKTRADRRASAVKRLGIDAEVSPRKRAGTVYWLEMPAKSDASTVSTEGIAPPDGDPLEVRACNAAPGSTPTARR